MTQVLREQEWKAQSSRSRNLHFRRSEVYPAGMRLVCQTIARRFSVQSILPLFICPSLCRPISLSCYFSYGATISAMVLIRMLAGYLAHPVKLASQVTLEPLYTFTMACIQETLIYQMQNIALLTVTYNRRNIMLKFYLFILILIFSLQLYFEKSHNFLSR